MNISFLTFNSINAVKNAKVKNQKSISNSQTSISFGKNGYIDDIQMQYTSAPVRNSWQYIGKIIKEGERVENFWARKFTEKMLPDVKKMFKEEQVTEDKTLFDLIVDRGDELKNIPNENVTYVNQRYKSALKDFSPKEIAYIMLSKGVTAEGYELAKYLETKKQLVSEEEYNERLLDVITGKTVHTNDIPKTRKIAPELEAKVNEAQELFTEGSNHKLIKEHMEEFFDLGTRKSAVYDLSKEELAFYMTTDLRQIGTKIPQQTFKHNLDRLKKYMPLRMYEQLLTESVQGKRKSPNEIIALLQKASSKLAPYRNFDDDQWTMFVLKNTELPQN